MGSGGSVSYHERREQVTERKKMLKSVERFIINVYATCPRLESMTLLLTSDSGRRAFLEFVTSEHADETLALYTEALNLVNLFRGSNHKKPISDDDFHDEFKSIVRKYIVVDSEISQVLLPMPLFDAIMKSLIAKPDTNNTIDNINNNDESDMTNNPPPSTADTSNTVPSLADIQQDLLEQIIDECILMMASIQLHRFITSKYFKKWRILEANHAIATTAMEIGDMPIWNSAAANTSLSSLRSSFSKEASVSFRSIDRSMRKIIYSSDGDVEKQNADLSIRAFKNIRFDELENILSVDSWLAILISAAEALSVSFAVTTVNVVNGNSGGTEFPIIYVNRYFEKMTGYPQHSVIGKKFFFMTCNESEQESIQNLKNGMNQGQQTSSIITVATIRKQLFKNLIIVKPIFSKKRKYIYTISIQMDVTKEVDAYVSKQKLVLDLINMLPSQYYIDEEEHDHSLYGCI